MRLEAMRTYYQKLRPYSNQDYVRDAKALIITRIKTHRYDHNAAFTKEVGDPNHGAQWSVLSRKRKSGLMLLTLYELATRYQLDMTATMGQRLLQGIYGISLANHTLLHAFANTGRTAADRSEDWPKIDTIAKDNQKYYLDKLEQMRARIKQNKELSWQLVELELSGKK